MKKRITIFMLLLGMLTVMAGCGSEVSVGEDSIDIHAMANELKSNLIFQDSLSEIDTDVALNYYGISSEMVKDSVAILSTGATAEEIAIFQASSKDYVKVIELACETRKSKQTISYADYKPEETSRLDHAIIETNGLYVIYCVADDTKKAEEIIDNYFK